MNEMVFFVLALLQYSSVASTRTADSHVGLKKAFFIFVRNVLFEIKIISKIDFRWEKKNLEIHFIRKT